MSNKKREAFNFYRSYFEVFEELQTDAEKLLFIKSVLEKQFYGIEPTNLDGMVKFAYISQKHSIDRQVKGWEDKTKVKLCTPLPTPLVTPLPTPLPTSIRVSISESIINNNNIPTIEDFCAYAFSVKKDLCKESLTLKYQSWVNNDWKNGNDKPIKNWKTTLLNTIPYIKTKVNVEDSFLSQLRPSHDLKSLYE